MFELLIMAPNLLAGYLTMKNNAFLANCVYCLGYVLFIAYNVLKTHDALQVIYFSILWVMSLMGVYIFVRKEKHM